jgi:hypothetical protein
VYVQNHSMKPKMEKVQDRQVDELKEVISLLWRSAYMSGPLLQISLLTLMLWQGSAL